VTSDRDEQKPAKPLNLSLSLGTCHSSLVTELGSLRVHRHFGVALAAKKVAPRTSLGLGNGSSVCGSALAAFSSLGVERVIIAPGTTAVTPLDLSPTFIHSLLADLGWACLFAGFTK